MQFYEMPDNRLPRGALVYSAKTKDNFRIRALTAAPLTATSRGTIVILNGRAEFVERYFETLSDFQARGFHVVGFDWRGQGGSQRILKGSNRGHVRSFREYDEDLRAVMEGVATKNCPGPYYAIGHSTGGHILLRSLSRNNWFKKAVVTSPLMELNYGSWPKNVALLLASIVTAFGFGWIILPGFKKPPMLLGPFEDNPLTSDFRRWQRGAVTLREHPELAVGGPTFSWLFATMRSLKALHSRRKGTGLNCPVLMILAGRERVVDSKASHAYASNMPGVSVVTITHSLHEIMLENDAVRKEFFAAVESYIG